MSPHGRVGFARSPRRCHVGLGAAIMLSLTSPALAGDSCPENSITVSRTDVGFQSTSPTGSLEITDQIVPWEAGQKCTEACYDLPNATIVARGSNSLYGPGDTFVRVADEYVVLGPAGPPLSFEVVLQLNAMIDIEGTAVAELGLGSSPSHVIQLTATGITQLALPVMVAPGTSFVINALATAVGGHLGGSGLAEVTYRFRGLPASHAIASCQGYGLETPTPPATWGSVKAQYH